MGKLRATIEAPRGSDDETVTAAALENARIAELAAGKPLRRSIVVKDKRVNLIFTPAQPE